MMDLDNIKILEEKEFYSHHFLYMATLENGIKICVKDDGSAIGEDGTTYYSISKTVDDELEILGWSSEVDGQIIID